MGFVGGGSNISIATALPPIIFCALYCKHQIVYVISLSYFLCLSEGSFLDVETNPGPWRSVPDVCRILRSNVRGLAWNLSDLTAASSQYAI